MKVAPKIPRTRGSATTTNGRLTRSAPEDVKALELDHRQRQAKAASTHNSGVSKELASLELEAPGAPKRPARASSSRYALRGSGKDILKPVPAGVTKTRSTGRSKAKKEYIGPGHRKEGAARISADGRECLICAEAQHDNEYPRLETIKGCDHESRVCRSCIARDTETKLQLNGKWQDLQCLECQGSLTKDQIWNLVWLDDFERLDDLAARRARETHARYRPCLSATCNAGQIHLSYKYPVVTCESCNSRSCFNHRIPWHDGYSCDGYDDSHPAAKSARTSEDRMKSTAKKCPGKNCSYYVEKDGGCPNMWCPQCQSGWNWDKVNFETRSKTIYKIAR